MRFTPASKVSTRSWYYHQACLRHASAQHACNLHGLDDLPADRKQEVLSLLSAAPSQAPRMGESAGASDHDAVAGWDAAAAEAFETNELRNLEFWGRFNWDSARRLQVNTMTTIPAELRHSVMEAKAAVLRDAAQGSEPAWQLLTIFDRLLLWSPMQGKAKWTSRQRQDAIAERLRLFWRGAWRELWDGAASGGVVESRLARRELTKQQKAARIEELIEEDELAKALKTVLQSSGPNTNPERVHELRALFPSCRPEDVVTPTLSCWDADFEARVEAAVQKLLMRLPRGSGAGPDGSRYEHWGGNSAAEVHVEPMARCMRMWLQGQAPEWAYASQRGGRLLALDKKDGGLRPLILCPVFRRIALRGLLASLKEDLGGYVGAAQYALGKKSGDVLLVRTMEAACATGSRNAVLSIDIRNAFGTMSRGWIAASLRRYAPKLEHIMPLLYATPTKHQWAADGRCFDVVAGTGVDQGCPFSMLAFMIGLRAVQENAARRMTEMGIDTVHLSYADDTYIVAAEHHLAVVEQIWIEEARRAGMELAAHKRAVWTRGDGSQLPPSLQASLTSVLPVLGHTAERDVLGATWVGVGEHGGLAWERCRVKLEGIMVELRTLMRAGLSKQSAQTMLRIWVAAVPQHVMRGALISDDLLEEMDKMISAWWADLLGCSDLSTTEHAQIHLPLYLGGLAAGGVRTRAAAAFLAGAAATYLPAAHTLGFHSVEQLLGHAPRFRTDAEAAADRLTHDGVREDVLGWMRGRMLARGNHQRQWTRAVHAATHAKILRSGPTSQVLGCRSGGGVGASAFLQPPQCAADRVADAHFVTSVRARLGMPLWPPANPVRPAGTAPQCQHRPRRGGPCCGAQLDADGRHAAQCEVGGHVLDRHDDAVKLIARRLRQDTGAYVDTEQRRQELDYLDDEGKFVAARLDLVVVFCGVEYLLDVTYADVRTTDKDRLAARLRRDGAAADGAEDRKRRRYPTQSLVPIAIESGGRLGSAGLRWLRSVYGRAGASLEWPAFLRELSAHTQAATATTIISATAGA